MMIGLNIIASFGVLITAALTFELNRQYPPRGVMDWIFSSILVFLVFAQAVGCGYLWSFIS